MPLTNGALRPPVNKLHLEQRSFVKSEKNASQMEKLILLNRYIQKQCNVAVLQFTGAEPPSLAVYGLRVF